MYSLENINVRFRYFARSVLRDKQEWLTISQYYAASTYTYFIVFFCFFFSTRSNTDHLKGEL